MKDCCSVLRRQILEDVLGEKVEEYENFNRMNENKRQHRKQIPLWKFLLHLLSRDKKSRYIEWSAARPLEFRIKDTSAVAELWGSMKNKTDMTYEKLGRAMRYYYGKSIIEKVCGKRYSYRFILSRRTKKYISQFINVTGMKVESIVDSNLGSPDDYSASPDDNSISDSASIGSTFGASEEDESNISSLDSPSSSLKVKSIKKEVYALEDTNVQSNSFQDSSKTYSQLTPNRKMCAMEQASRRISAFSRHPIIAPKRRTNIKREELENEISSVDRNQFQHSTFDDNHFQHAIADRNQFQHPTIDGDQFQHPTADRNQFQHSGISLNDIQHFNADINKFNIENNNSCWSRKRELENINNYTCDKKIKLNDEHEQCVSSSSESISSGDLDNETELATTFLENDLLQHDLEATEIDDNENREKTNIFIDRQQEVKLERQIDPFMGADYMRYTEYDRCETSDLSFYELFEDYLY